ncbi:ArsR/SmtB family transcription factor [Paraconexibacter algicola]|uniref:Transcriptional regulator n=1 Tax=Paraconexibacter algicola TaxID=2133960 RepID=A0A2T4UKQ7_9ACTN|nr:metalloregulator ArsR/SmtB family transcription factor [Paraconexibacter algicola]PTL59829.1 transcriptional regulator [Paraconexibacter algicola]
MSSELAAIAAVLADPTRTRILEELLGGVPLPAGALATRVGVAPSTVSGHLTRLVDAGLVTVTPVGRRREVALAGPRVAEALEALGRLAPAPRPIGLRAVTRAQALRHARSCYDHLAGEVGVRVTDALVACAALRADDGGFAVPAGAQAAYAALGVDLDAVRATAASRPLARACADWTERRPHLAGALGAALLDAALAQDWVRRRPDGRALTVTAAGAAALSALERRSRSAAAAASSRPRARSRPPSPRPRARG